MRSLAAFVLQQTLRIYGRYAGENRTIFVRFERSLRDMCIRTVQNFTKIFFT